MSKYEQVYLNEPFPQETGKNALELACCDCGLVHNISIKVINKNMVELTFNVDKRKTAACRRHWGIEGSATVVFRRKKHA